MIFKFPKKRIRQNFSLNSWREPLHSTTFSTRLKTSIRKVNTEKNVVVAAIRKLCVFIAAAALLVTLIFFSPRQQLRNFFYDYIFCQLSCGLCWNKKQVDERLYENMRHNRGKDYTKVLRCFYHFQIIEIVSSRVREVSIL